MFKLRKLNMKMGKPEWEMYQDIPAKESGATNLGFGVPYEVFGSFLESRLAREFQKISDYDTPVVTYVLYKDKTPMGFICIRTKINKKWKEWCGHIFYAIRKSERSKGYGTKMLELALKECRKIGFTKVFIKASSGNIASRRIIEKNGGEFLKTDKYGGTYYQISLNK